VTEREKQLEKLLKHCLEATIDTCPEQGDSALQAPWLRRGICEALGVEDPEGDEE
jgi:hypothetical protein